MLPATELIALVIASLICGSKTPRIATTRIAVITVIGLRRLHSGPLCPSVYGTCEHLARGARLVEFN